MSLTANPRILIGVTGSMDVPLVPKYLSGIKKEIDCHLTVLATGSAEKFMPATTLGLFADRVISGERPCDWPTDKPSKIVADHDIIGVLPATANTLSVVAQGGAPNRLTTVILAAGYSVLFFPVMGDSMWKKPAVKRNIGQIREDGYEVIEPVWHQNFDASLKRMVGHPSLPTVDAVVDIFRDRLESSLLNKATS